MTVSARYTAAIAALLFGALSAAFGLWAGLPVPSALRAGAVAYGAAVAVAAHYGTHSAGSVLTATARLLAISAGLAALVAVLASLLGIQRHREVWA
ncbi:hypothetical protein [Actinacidiphila glaucinigra]|uniref:hypothetical protein n=1 Tax=Actinacidiphila glaucinigra TaxID=235986 RepID=UPI00371E0AED